MSNQPPGNWQIAYIVDEPAGGSEAPTTTIHALELMSLECHEAYKNDKRLIFEYFNSLGLVQSVQLNIQQFLEAVVHYAADFLETRDMNGEKFDLIALDFSRLLLNILSMFRSFLDHSDVSLSRKFGKESTQVKMWKEALVKQYDNSFEYRFFYKLRNYSQHVGVPPIAISFSDSAGQEGVGFRLDFKRGKLLEEKGSWNQQLKEDLLKQPEEIPVINCLNNWGECFRDLSATLLKIKREAALNAAQQIVKHRIRLELPENVGSMCTVWLPESKPNPAALNLTIDWMPEQKARTIIEDSAFKLQTEDD